MLCFNPHKRLSTKECLKNPIFDSIRNKNIEKGPNFIVTTEIDSDELNSQFTTVQDYMNLLVEEVLKAKESKIRTKLMK